MGDSEHILDAFKLVLPYFKYFFDDDISVALGDKNNFLVNYSSDTIPINIVPGTEISKQGAAYQVI